MSKKTVWLHISIEVDAEYRTDAPEENDDEALMDIIRDELVEQGFTIDDMGMIDPTDTDKFYPETEDDDPALYTFDPARDTQTLKPVALAKADALVNINEPFLDDAIDWANE